MTSLSRARLCATPWTAAHQAPVPGSLQAGALEWGAIAFSNAVESDPQRPHALQPSRLPRPRDSPGESTGVGHHRLLRSRGLGSSSSKAKMFSSLCFPTVYNVTLKGGEGKKERRERRKKERSLKCFMKSG